MRATLLMTLVIFAVGAGCSKESAKEAGMRIATRDAMELRPDAKEEAPIGFVMQKEGGGQPQPQAEAKKEKPRKIRYTAELRLIVENLDKAEAALDDARKAAQGEYAKAEINTSAGSEIGRAHV